MRILTVAYSMYRRSMNKKSTLIIYIMAPVIALIIPLLFYTNINGRNSIGVIDNDNTYISKRIIIELSNKEDFNIYILNKNDASRYLAQNKTIATIEIPYDFFNNINSENIKKIDIKYLQDNKEIIILKKEVERVISKIYESVNKSESEYEFISTYNEIDKNELIINRISTNSDIIDNVTIGFIVIFLIIIYTNSLSTIIKDRNEKIYKKILLTSTSSNEYIYGQLLWNCILLLIQSSILIACIIIFKIKIGMTIYRFLYLLIITGILAMAMGIFIISLCKNENQISIVSTLIIFPSSMLSGALWPMDIMNDSIQKISYIFPQRYLFKLVELFQKNSNRLETILIITIIVLISSLIMYIGLIRLNNIREDYI